jgi:hypothetical protein
MLPFGWGTLGRIVPERARPAFRRLLSAIRTLFDRLGMPTVRERSYQRRLIVHAHAGAAPRIRTSFAPERKPIDVDIEIAIRVLRAWHEATPEKSTLQTTSVADVWDGLAGHYHGELLTILQKKDPFALAEYLCNMSRHGATVGITQGITEFRRISTSRHYREWTGLLTLDRLVALAEAVGVLRMENPEQGRWGENLYEDIDELIHKLQTALGIGIIIPQVEGCLLGLDNKSGRLHFRDLTALYAAWRIRTITNQLGAASICEIGGGVGRVAYYCAKFGIKNYAIYDLPLVNVLQGYFLIRSNPDARIVLYGEQVPAQGHAIRILPGRALEDSSPKSFDVVLNQDSFPEIDRSTVRRYLREIRRSTRTHFLSINHEAETPIGVSTLRHLVVADIVDEVGGFERLYRCPCWVRAGYVEELYKVL